MQSKYSVYKKCEHLCMQEKGYTKILIVIRILGYFFLIHTFNFPIFINNPCKNSRNPKPSSIIHVLNLGD